MRTFGIKPCLACERDFQPTGPRSKLCEKCVTPEKKARKVAPTPRVEPAPPPVATVVILDEPAAMEPLDVIDAFGLDFNSGNAVRFLLEQRDGDVLANLRSAHAYLERAIARAEAA